MLFGNMKQDYERGIGLMAAITKELGRSGRGRGEGGGGWGCGGTLIFVLIYQAELLDRLCGHS